MCDDDDETDDVDDDGTADVDIAVDDGARLDDVVTTNRVGAAERDVVVAVCATADR